MKLNADRCWTRESSLRPKAQINHNISFEPGRAQDELNRSRFKLDTIFDQTSIRYPPPVPFLGKI